MKIDQLENYFALTNEYWISGSDSVNLLFWGLKSDRKVSPKIITINVAVDYNPKKVNCFDLHEYMVTLEKVDTHFKKLVNWATSISSLLPVYIIGYPALREYQNSEWSSSEDKYPLEDVVFYLESLNSEPSGTISGKHLRTKIYEKLGIFDLVQGTKKAENKSIHDYFMYWSRTFLSPSIVKFDCDGLFFASGKTSLVEIKRSPIPPIPNWCPYLDDAANYQIQSIFAKAIGANTFLIHHEGIPKESKKTYYDGTEKVDFYWYIEVDQTKYAQAKNSNRKFAEYLECKTVKKDIKLSDLKQIILLGFQGNEHD